MKRQSRRLFLKKAAAGTMAAWVPVGLHGAVKQEASSRIIERLPAHRAIALPGIHAYASTQSVMAGNEIQFHVSSSVPFSMSIYRLGREIDSSTADELLHAFPQSKAIVQPIHPGSYAYVAKGIRGKIEAISLSCWFRTWKPLSRQGLISQTDSLNESSLELLINDKGEVEFHLNGATNEKSKRFAKPKARRWHHVVAVWNGAETSLWFDGKRVGSDVLQGPSILGKAPIRIGALGVKHLGRPAEADHFLEGDIALPAIHERALTDVEILALYEQRAAFEPPPAQLLACWPLDEERGPQIRDLSSHRRTGRIVNQATWMIGGPDFQSDKAPRYASYSPDADPTRGHAIRFASDDLYDCRWLPTHSWQVPRKARPGIYVARLNYVLDGQEQVYHVTFIVRRSQSASRPPILVLCSTNTWLAYNSTPFSENIPPGYFLDTGGYRNSHPGAPVYSCYRDHFAGLPTYQIGLRTPWPCAGPYVLYSSKETGYSHLMRAERFLHVWLESEGYEFDVVADIDLHRHPEMLRHYKTVILNGHSEYWSIQAYEGLDRYLQRGGTTIVLSGNTMFWRVSFDDSGSVMECRKFDERIGGRKLAPLGELFHSHDGNRGSLMRECGYPAWNVIGLECAGWGDVETKSAGVYETEDPNHFLFNRPEKVGLSKGDSFGHSPGGQSHKAIGHEYDIRLSSLARMTKSIPAGGQIPKEPPGITTLANGKRPKDSALDYFTNPTNAPESIVAEMIYWERPQGGKVFHAGTIGSGWSMSADPKFQKLLRNVLSHFGVSRK